MMRDGATDFRAQSAGDGGGPDTPARVARWERVG
jgi:hypothetical protein